MKYEYKINGVVLRITRQLITKHIEYSFKSIANYWQSCYLKKFRRTMFWWCRIRKSLCLRWKKLEYSLLRRLILIWAEEPPLKFWSMIDNKVHSLENECELHWIFDVFYRFVWISIFNTRSNGEIITGVMPIDSTNHL